ncbi:hypothetical protein [Rhodoluna limnophila]|uniref:hypothetical protein n=1 Tax=Rhodoluna limnophila TaxID=232537 RepID=UPI001105E124|nr:hypothetical protein [Rhodoluna limnophila]
MVMFLKRYGFRSNALHLGPEPELQLALVSGASFILCILVGRGIVSDVYGVSVLRNAAIFVGVHIAVIGILQAGKSVFRRRKFSLKWVITTSLRLGLAFSAFWYAFVIWFFDWPANPHPEQPLDYEGVASTVIALTLVLSACIIALSAFFRITPLNRT